MQRDLHTMTIERFAIRQRGNASLFTDPAAQDPLAGRSGEIMFASGSRVVAMRVRDHGILDRLPRIDVEIAGG
jgi:hypothetical protein